MVRSADGYDGAVAGMTLRERRRRDTREALTDSAYELVAERGFDRTTVEANAERAGVGRTTAFRHCPTKEDLLLAWLDDVRDRLEAALASTPREVAPLDAIRRAFGDLAGAYVDHRDRTLAVARLAEGTASVRARYLERKLAWIDIIAADVAARLGVDVAEDLRPRLVAEVALAAASAASAHWLARDGEPDLAELLDDAMVQLGRGLSGLSE